MKLLIDITFFKEDYDDVEESIQNPLIIFMEIWDSRNVPHHLSNICMEVWSVRNIT